MSEAKTIYELLPLVAKGIGAISKDSRNESQGYKFRGIDAVINKAHDVLVEHRVTVVPRVIAQEVTEREVERSNGKTGINRYVELTIEYEFYGPRGDSVTACVVGEAMDSGDKASNKAMSAAFKYALFQVFSIPVAEIDDADATSDEFTTPGRSYQRGGTKQLQGNVTENQANHIKKTLAAAGQTWQTLDVQEAVQDIIGSYPASIDKLTKQQASDLITGLKERLS